MHDTFLRMGLLLTLAVPVMGGCEEDDSPVEEAGDRIEDATDDIGD